MNKVTHNPKFLCARNSKHKISSAKTLEHVKLQARYKRFLSGGHWENFKFSKNELFIFLESQSEKVLNTKLWIILAINYLFFETVSLSVFKNRKKAFKIGSVEKLDHF